jgi:diketogulonate reductase-like aldo/keto reductase
MPELQQPLLVLRNHHAIAVRLLIEQSTVSTASSGCSAISSFLLCLYTATTGGMLLTALQVEAHPYWPNTPLLRSARAAGIHVTAYSPLGSPDSAMLLKRQSAQLPTGPAASAAGGAAAEDPNSVPQLLQHPLVVNIAHRLHKSAAQVSGVTS